MRVIKPVIQLAKERALFRFSALAIRMLEDANVSVGQLKFNSASTQQQKTILQAREWLATQGPVFLKRLYTSYCGYVERGMLTMYRDLRKQESQGLSADTWALIDDDTIMRQIEVERRVLRLRDADQISLGRLNLMIAQLHDEHDVRERENPFRPYLMARALHDVLCEMSSTSDLCAMLFDHLSGALATQLPEYFSAICAVFESNGVHARLLARPSAISRRDRDMLPSSTQTHRAGNTHAPNLHTGNTFAPAERERVFSLLQQASPEWQNTLSTQQESQAMLQDFVWKIFHQAAQSKAQDGAEKNAFKPHPLNSQLHSLQKKTASAAQDDVVHLFDLHEELATERLTEMEGVALDVVAMLFKFIAMDASLPSAFRAVIVRLQVPFLKVALQTPAILEKTEHPLKNLLNRMASLSVALDAQTAPGQEILAEMKQIAGKILAEFKSDTTIFSDALKQLNAFVEKFLRACDAEVSHAASALEAAEKDPQRHDVFIMRTANALRERLLTIETEQRAADFIVKIWARVLVHAAEQEEMALQPYRDVVPDLLWSVQSHEASERAALMQLLPGLVKRVKEGLRLIAMPEEASRQALDDLMAMHARVLGTIPLAPQRTSVTLASLHQHFSSLDIGDGETALQAPTVSNIRLQAALQKFNVAAHLHLDSDAGTLLGSDNNWLGNMQVGTSIEWWDSYAYQPARLMWINPEKSFYIFTLNALQDEQSGSPRLLIYSSISLIKALREGSIGMLEYAPLFERAIDSLLSSNDAQQRIAI